MINWSGASTALTMCCSVSLPAGLAGSCSQQSVDIASSCTYPFSTSHPLDARPSVGPACQDGPVTLTADADILSALDPEQREAVEAIRGPVCILAGAGTGKTRAITHRIAFAVSTGVVAPAHVLAVTFTVRAAGELRGRLRALGVGTVQARTFHSAALRQLQYFWPRTIGGELPTILKSKVPLLAEVGGRMRLGLSASDLRDVASEIEWMKALQRPPDDYASSVQLAHRIAPRPVTEITALYAGYEDVNPAQQRLLDAWLGDRDDLCVVGDPEQTIYSFAGASAEYLTGFSTRYP